MTLIAAQRKAIQDGLSYDTCMDGLNSTTPYHQTSQAYKGTQRTEMANAYSVQPARAYAPWAAPEPARPQNQWGAQAPARFQSQWGPGGPHAVQMMPTAPMTCYGCGQAGHMKREFPIGGV